MSNKKKLTDKDLSEIANFAAAIAGGDNRPAYTHEQQQELWRRIGQKPDFSDGNGQSAQKNERLELN